MRVKAEWVLLLAWACRHKQNRHQPLSAWILSSRWREIGNKAVPITMERREANGIMVEVS